MSDKKIFLSSSPHFTEGLTTKTIMGAVILSMIPECIAGVIFFGLPALITILTSVVCCVLFEFLFQKITKQTIRVNDLSAVVTGILLALVLPPTTPVWMTVLGAMVAVVLAKGLFGGIGANVFNPALTGRAFMFISFPAALGASWLQAGTDAVSSATTLSAIKAGTFEASSEVYKQFFLGSRAGCIGETSILLILISFAFLSLIHVIRWYVPATMVATVALLTCISGGDVAMAVMSGGLLFGAVFMITDYATTPQTQPGRIIFAAGCGIITFLIRKFGGYPEGVMFSILIMNSIAPFLNNVTVRMYGYGKKGNRKPAPRKIVQDFDVANAKDHKEAN